MEDSLFFHKKVFNVDSKPKEAKFHITELVKRLHSTFL